MVETGSPAAASFPGRVHLNSGLQLLELTPQVLVLHSQPCGVRGRLSPRTICFLDPLHHGVPFLHLLIQLLLGESEVDPVVLGLLLVLLRLQLQILHLLLGGPRGQLLGRVLLLQLLDEVILGGHLDGHVAHLRLLEPQLALNIGQVLLHGTVGNAHLGGLAEGLSEVAIQSFVLLA